MKKILFFIAASALCAFVMAQTSSNQFYKKIGETYYNSFTNSCSRNTIGFDSQSLKGAAVWTMGSSSANRGTGINYYNANDNTWGDVPNLYTDRIETETTGWGTHGFTEEGEIVVAHNVATGLTVNTRDIAGEGEWQQSILQGPNYILNGSPTTELIWPTMITNGNTVHLVCVTGQWPTSSTFPPDYEPNPNNPPHGYLGFSTLPLYYRSTDGGKTWEEPRDFRAYGMTNVECFRIASDGYVLAVRGNHVVMLYFNVNVGFLCYMESKDGGDTWVKKTIYDCGMDFVQSNLAADPRLMPTSASIFIDENHKVHVVFSAQCRAKDAGTSTTLLSWGQLPVGMIYWNEDREPIDWHDIRGWKNETGNLTSYNWESYQGYIPVPSVLGLNKFYRWVDGPVYDKNQYSNLGWSIYPRLLVKDGRVYVTYQSPLDFPMEDNSFFYRGIFITVSEDYGATWDVQNNTSWISYQPGIFFADWTDYLEPAYSPEGTPLFYPAVWVYLLEVSESGFPSMSYNYKGDQFMLQWANANAPFSYPGGFGSTPISIYSFTQDLKNIPAYKNIQEVCRGMWNDADQAIAFPSQSCEKPAEFTAIYSYGENRVDLNWEKPEYISQPLVGYNIFCNGLKINEYPITETHFEVENPELGSNHYQVSAVYSGCESNLTYGTTVYVAFYCEKPVELTGSIAATDAILSWNEPENIDGILLGYNIYRDENQLNETLLEETEYIDKNLADGTYLYQVSAVYEHCGESDLTEGYEIVYVGIPHLQTPAIKMYPNPTMGELTIENGELTIENVEIFDVFGRKLSSHHQITSSSNPLTPPSHHQMNVSHLASGVYFVKIYTEPGVPVTKRLVVVR